MVDDLRASRAVVLEELACESDDLLELVGAERCGEGLELGARVSGAIALGARRPARRRV